MKAIIAFDDSDAAKEALKFSMKFKGVIDEFIIVYVSPSLIGVTPTFDTYIPASVYQRQEETSDSIIESAKKIAGDTSSNLTFVNVDSKGETVPKAIMRTAKERGADIIITGTRIREKMLRDDSWKADVPDAVRDIIEEIDGVRRIRDLSKTDEE